MNPYGPLPKPGSTFPADDGGTFVVGWTPNRDGSLTPLAAALALVAGCDYAPGDESIEAARAIADRGEAVVLHRCLEGDDMGDEPGWWHPDGSGVALPCIYFPREVVDSL